MSYQRWSKKMRKTAMEEITVTVKLKKKTKPRQ